MAGDASSLWQFRSAIGDPRYFLSRSGTFLLAITGRLWPSESTCISDSIRVVVRTFDGSWPGITATVVPARAFRSGAVWT